MHKQVAGFGKGCCRACAFKIVKHIGYLYTTSGIMFSPAVVYLFLVGSFPYPWLFKILSGRWCLSFLPS